MKKVEWFEHVSGMKDNKYFVNKESRGKAKFLRFGLNYEELANGAGIFSTAIIKLPDGTVRNIPVENIKFI
jgi:hypothetical protein